MHDIIARDVFGKKSFGWSVRSVCRHEYDIYIFRPCECGMYNIVGCLVSG